MKIMNLLSFETSIIYNWHALSFDGHKLFISEKATKQYFCGINTIVA